MPWRRSALLLGGRAVPDAVASGVVQVRRFGERRAAWRSRAGAQPATTGVLTPFQAFMTALGASIGTGNIAGVATAIVSGGPGALFWIWVYGFVATAIKFAEAVLGVTFREARGEHGAVRPDVLPARRPEVAGARVDLRARRRRRGADDDAVHAAELDRGRAQHRRRHPDAGSPASSSRC